MKASVGEREIEKCYPQRLQKNPRVASRAMKMMKEKEEKKEINHIIYSAQSME